MAERNCEIMSDAQIFAKDILRIYEEKNGVSVCTLKDMNLQVNKQEIVSLIGPSGCGKSTFLRLIAGLDKPQGGIIENDGEEISGLNKKCGFMFQEANLFPWLAIYDNVAFGLKINKKFKENRKKVKNYIDLMGLSGFEKSFPYQISGGIASRASLARTFIQEPEIILLDEPLSALDAFTRENLQEAIIKIWNENKPSIILVTHDIEEAIYLSHRVIVMSERPSKVVEEVKINIPYPRNRISEEFIRYRKKIKEILEKKGKNKNEKEVVDVDS